MLNKLDYFKKRENFSIMFNFSIVLYVINVSEFPKSMLISVNE